MGKLKVTLKRSTIKKPKRAKRTVKALGLTRLHQSVEHEDNKAMRGMIRKVNHLVNVEEIND